MRRIILLSLFILAAATCIHAAKSSGTPKAVKQPDGTTLMVRLLGDEHFSWHQTMDGVVIMQQDKAFYVAEICADGSLKSTGVLAHNLDSRKGQELQLAKAQDKSLFSQKEQKLHRQDAKPSQATQAAISAHTVARYASLS